MMRRSISRAARPVSASTIPTTSRRCQSSMPAGFYARASVPQPRPRALWCNALVSRLTRTAAWAVLVGSLAALAYGSRLSDGKPPDDALYRYETAVGGISVYVILLLVVLWIGHGLPKREFLALRRPSSWGRALGLALGAYVAIFIGAGLLLIALDAGGEQGLTPDDWESSHLGAYAANFVAIALVGPIV